MADTKSSHPQNKADPTIWQWLLYGTPEYHAPELCFAPYLTKFSQLEELRSPHTCKSDMWAVACIMHALCERDIMAHSE